MDACPQRLCRNGGRPTLLTAGRLIVFTAASGATLFLTTGCPRAEDGPPAHSEVADGGHGHEHVAPHGGTAVILGDEAYHVELVRDPAEGKLRAYVLDGHMEQFVRTNARQFEVLARVDSEEHVLVFQAVSEAETGERPGDSATFEASAEWLRDAAEFSGQLKSLSIRGVTFTDVRFEFPAGNELPHP